MNRAILISTIWLLSFSTQDRCQADSRGLGTPSDPKSLELTVRRYFAGMARYEEGDLISFTQVAELQQYLRKTTGHSAASHPSLLRQVLPDASRLSRLFYAKRGAKVLTCCRREIARLRCTGSPFTNKCWLRPSDRSDRGRFCGSVGEDYSPGKPTSGRQSKRRSIIRSIPQSDLLAFIR